MPSNASAAASSRPTIEGVRQLADGGSSPSFDAHEDVRCWRDPESGRVAAGFREWMGFSRRGRSSRERDHEDALFLGRPGRNSNDWRWDE